MSLFPTGARLIFFSYLCYHSLSTLRNPHVCSDTINRRYSGFDGRFEEAFGFHLPDFLAQLSRKANGVMFCKTGGGLTLALSLLAFFIPEIAIFGGYSHFFFSFVVNNGFAMAGESLGFKVVEPVLLAAAIWAASSLFAVDFEEEIDGGDESGIEEDVQSEWRESGSTEKPELLPPNNKAGEGVRSWGVEGPRGPKKLAKKFRGGSEGGRRVEAGDGLMGKLLGLFGPASASEDGDDGPSKSSNEKPTADSPISGGLSESSEEGMSHEPKKPKQSSARTSEDEVAMVGSHSEGLSSETEEPLNPSAHQPLLPPKACELLGEALNAPTPQPLHPRKIYEILEVPEEDEESISSCGGGLREEVSVVTLKGRQVDKVRTVLLGAFDL